MSKAFWYVSAQDEFGTNVSTHLVAELSYYMLINPSELSDIESLVKLHPTPPHF
jgi:hypothetical protein